MLPDESIRRQIKLQNLFVFMTVAEVGSMSRAAQRLNTVQPAVSRSIAELERAFGVRLLDRDRKGIKPTAYGRALLDCGAAAFDELRRGVRNIEALADPEGGEVRIGCSPLLSASYVTTVIDHISRRKPRVSFQIVTGYAEELHNQLVERKVDVWIARFDDVVDLRLHREVLFEDSYVVVANAQSPWSGRRKLTLPDLLDEAWALPPLDSRVGSYLAQAFRACGLEYPRVTVMTSSPETRFGLLAMGRYLTMMPTFALRFPARRPELKVLPLSLPLPAVPVSIVTLKDRALSPAAEHFIETAREVGRPLQRGNG
jgi:DNA-binding transcriptional LysR family regulator